jgi:hypothetical protein
MKNIIFISLLFLTFNQLNAQSETKETKENINLIIKYSPMSLVNVIYPSMQFALEHRIAERRSLQYEFGGLYYRNPLVLTRGNTTVFRGLVEYRWYKETPTFDKKNKFQGIGFRFQQRVNAETPFTLRRDDFQNILSLDNVNTATGVYYTKGFQRVYDGKISVEFGGSLGIQYYDVSVRDAPEGVTELALNNDSGLFAFQPGSLVVPMAFLVLKVGFVAK